MYLDIKTSTYNVIVDEVNRNHYIADFICRASNHPDDNYLYLVIASNDNEYVTWLANTSGNQVGLYEGHYGLSFKEAMQIIADKIKEEETWVGLA